MEKQRKNNRRTPNECYLVFERFRDQFIGQVINMSPDGIMLNSDHSVEISKQFKCRMGLPKKISNLAQIEFDVECKWCRKNDKSDAYESGFQLINVSEKDQKVINLLLRSWPITASETVNT